MPVAAVPSFYLYGEPPRAVENTFVHVERLDDRSRPSEWTIRPHLHSDLHQIFVLDSGGGIVTIEGTSHPIAAPGVILIPATAIHGFDWQEETTGWVLTVARAFHDSLALRHGELEPLYSRGHLLPLAAEGLERILGLVGDLQRELSWGAIGHGAMARAILLQLSVLCVRLANAGSDIEVKVAGSSAAALVARYRAQVEATFRDRQPMARRAASLGVSESALRHACAQIAGRSPSQIMDDRALLEARRLLVYSGLSVAQIGYSLGFGDPAYFSRFFSRHMGNSPTSYRK